jgi:predicted ATPase
MDNGYAEIQKYYNVYSLNMPIFKQSGNNGGVTSSKITEMGIPVSSSDNFFNQVKYDLNKLQGVPDLNNCPSNYYPSKIV